MKRTQNQSPTKYLLSQHVIYAKQVEISDQDRSN